MATAQDVKQGRSPAQRDPVQRAASHGERPPPRDDWKVPFLRGNGYFEQVLSHLPVCLAIIC